MTKKELIAIIRDNEVIIISDDNTYERFLELIVPNTASGEMVATMSNNILIVRPGIDSGLDKMAWEHALVEEFITEVLNELIDWDYLNDTCRCWWYE